MKRKHFIIPDGQVRPGVPIAHFRWLGAAIREYEPDEVVMLGDHWDFASLSSHSSLRQLEGKRVVEDIRAGNKALEALEEALEGFQPKGRTLLRGNHEHRLERFLGANPVMEGIIGEHLFNDRELGWDVVPYKNGSPGIKVIDGISYAHYFTNTNTGKPIGGTAHYKLAAIGTPFVQGHVQGLDIGTKQFATGRTLRGIVAGSGYLHDEEYKGPANTHWRGALVLNEVEGGQFSVMDLTMDYLCRKYEGMSVKRFLQRNYRNAKQQFSLAQDS